MTDFHVPPSPDAALQEFIDRLAMSSPTKQLLQAVHPQFTDAATHMSVWRENHKHREEGKELTWKA